MGTNPIRAWGHTFGGSGLSGTRLLRLPANWPVWFAAGLPFLFHLQQASAHLAAGTHQAVRPFQDLGGGVREWALTYLYLFAKPETAAGTVQAYALWSLALLGLAVYAAHRQRRPFPGAVALFYAYAAATVCTLAVVLPAAWILLGGWGPAAAELIPPVIMFLVALQVAGGVK